MLKPIQTPYRGYQFRSRLEARWAVFFDTLGVKWDYEFEGYQLSHRKYLPDFHFRVPVSDAELTRYPWRGRCFLEIKGVRGDPYEESTTMCELRDVSGIETFCAIGLPGDTHLLRAFQDGCGMDDYYDHHSPEESIAQFLAQELRAPRRLGSINNAIAAARGARFEFGESG